jgi:hypothetical protein
MLTVKLVALLVLVVSLGQFGLSWAAEAQKTIQLLARILPRASLSLDRTQITFVGYGDQAVIPSQEGPLAVMAKGRGNPMNPLTLTVRATSDLESSQGHIPIQQVQWTYQGQGSTSGALTIARDQVVGLWTKGGVNRGALQFVLNNNGHLAPGDYAGAVILTLSSP